MITAKITKITIWLPRLLQDYHDYYEPRLRKDPVRNRPSNRCRIDIDRAIDKSSIRIIDSIKFWSWNRSLFDVDVWWNYRSGMFGMSRPLSRKSLGTSHVCQAPAPSDWITPGREEAALKIVNIILFFYHQLQRKLHWSSSRSVAKWMKERWKYAGGYNSLPHSQVIPPWKCLDHLICESPVR